MMRASLLSWYDAAHRDLPWRRTRHFYPVWVSEVMLQQTQVATALPYYLRWISRFPTVQALAAASESEALALWQGLGYYRRCSMLVRGARWVVEHGVPSSAEEWRQVPGVGRYTAAAIASICLGEAAPLVDGNVRRVFARLTDSRECGRALEQRAWEWAAGQAGPDRPGDWNQALMELGATVCTPRAPKCDSCPVSACCRALRSGRQADLPVREPASQTRRMRHIVWVPVYEGRLGLRQVPPGQWWEGMWEFPRGECADAVAAMVGEGSKEELGVVRHTVTRHRITIEAALVRAAAPSRALVWHEPSALPGIPMPAPQRRVLELALPWLCRGDAP